MASITTWHRLIPISKSADFATAIAAEVHDPMWMLARQHQIGELRGEDTGSPAFVRVGYKAAPLVDLVLTPSPNQSDVYQSTNPPKLDAYGLGRRTASTAKSAARVPVLLTFHAW